MKTSDLTVRIDSDWGCWIAFAGSTPEDSNAIGEGSTREAAIADFWYGIHNGKTASLLDPYDAQEDCWKLFDGVYVARFQTREEAVAFGEAHQYIVNPSVQEV